MAKLCPKGKAAAKRKFKVYPSAYANMYASKVCKGKVRSSAKEGGLMEPKEHKKRRKEMKARKKSDLKIDKAMVRGGLKSSYARGRNPMKRERLKEGFAPGKKIILQDEKIKRTKKADGGKIEKIPGGYFKQGFGTISDKALKGKSIQQKYNELEKRKVPRKTIGAKKKRTQMREGGMVIEDMTRTIEV